MTQFLDHLANDVMPALIERLASKRGRQAAAPSKQRGLDGKLNELGRRGFAVPFYGFLNPRTSIREVL